MHGFPVSPRGFKAMVAEVQRSHAEEASRNVGAIAELQHRVQGCVAAAAAPAGAAQGGLSRNPFFKGYANVIRQAARTPPA